jgi:hypothetical protein
MASWPIRAVSWLTVQLMAAEELCSLEVITLEQVISKVTWLVVSDLFSKCE